MAGQLDYRRMTEADMGHVIANLRDADRLEVLRLAPHLTPQMAIEYTCQRAVAALVGTFDGEPMCIFGINRKSSLSDVGVPWMMGTNLLMQAGWPFVRMSKPVADRMALAFPVQENWVDAENTLSVDWLRWLGFDMEEPAPVASGALFIRFTKGMRDVS